jgi:hypothetical protein
MASLSLTVRPSKTAPKKRFVLELDLDRLEKLMEACGWYSEEFLKSLDRAEEDLRMGRVYPFTSFKDLRAKSARKKRV